MPSLKRFVLCQYHQGQVTIPRLDALLADLGIDISKRQIVRLLSAKKDAFLAEAIEVLRAGLAAASWITVDDTGARHKAQNGFCTHIGNDRFTFFATTGSKSRLNFLELLRRDPANMSSTKPRSPICATSSSPRPSLPASAARSGASPAARPSWPI